MTISLIRFIDITLAISGMLILFPVFAVVFILGIFDTGSPLFMQQRVGKNQKIFTLIKFRTMKKETAQVATHLASKSSITRIGSLLRKTKLDELPQLYNVLKGEMSLVGPRPCLANQYELIEERQKRGVFDVRPGVTGLAQINDIDMSTPVLLAQTDAHMINEYSVQKYIDYLLKTMLGRGMGDRIN